MWLDRLLRRYKEVECADGTTRLVYYNVDNAFPMGAKQIKKNAYANISALDKIKGGFGFQMDVSVSDLLSRIDTANASTQLHYRAAYTVYTTNPCQNDLFLQRATDAIRFEEGKFRDAGIKLQAILTIISARQGAGVDQAMTTEITEQLKSVLQTLNSPPPAVALANEMAQVSGLTKDWQKQ